MTEREQRKISKFLSLILRHKPEIAGITLDRQGWADTQELLAKTPSKGFRISLEQLKEVVKNNDKKRFAFSEDFSRIRASQGHSIPIDLDLQQVEPPDILYHGTAVSNLPSIREQGIHKRSRQYVHLSVDIPSAIKVGSRHGKPVALEIRAGEMHKQGNSFFLSENGIWLTEQIPPEFITFPS